MITFDEQVAIVTGAGQGLGRSHALALASRGARVVVNDPGGARDGTGVSTALARAVVDEIEAGGGEAVADTASVTDAAAVSDMVERTIDRWGRIDILVNNAGILRDKSFMNMTLEDFSAVLEVHLVGTAICTHAVWGHMRGRSYGRILVTSSASGLYGSFGQANYAAAKLGVIGLMNTLNLEGEKYDIRVNGLAPVAHTRMTDELLPEDAKALLLPEAVTPAVLFLVSEDAPKGVVMTAGAGGFAAVEIVETEGIWLSEEVRTPEEIAEHFDEIVDREHPRVFRAGSEQTMKFLGQAIASVSSGGE